MNDEASACKRAANFSVEEIDMLMDLIKKRKHIIESKKTDRVLWKEKDTAWEDIAKEFNIHSNSTVYRSAVVLRKKYENLKKRTKQKFADNRCQITGTGGGPPSDIKISVVDEDIKDILGVRLEGLPSYFDSDTTEDVENAANEEIIIVHNDTTEDVENAANEEIIIVHSDPSTSSGQRWSKYTPSSLQEAISVPLQNNINTKVTAMSEGKPTKKRKVTGSVTNEKWASLADTKNDVLHIQKKYMEEEHQAKMQLLQEQHHLALLQIEEQTLKNELIKLDLLIKQKTFDNVKT